uniref:Uncharacterized protein n=1 Tax=Heterorhabditis bacteriophora TaxID=37862 RepID=A0A1I7WGR4_HETBA
MQWLNTAYTAGMIAGCFYGVNNSDVNSAVKTECDHLKKLKAFIFFILYLRHSTTEPINNNSASVIECLDFFFL